MIVNAYVFTYGKYRKKIFDINASDSYITMRSSSTDGKKHSRFKIVAGDEACIIFYSNSLGSYSDAMIIINIYICSKIFEEIDKVYHMWFYRCMMDRKAFAVCIWKKR